MAPNRWMLALALALAGSLAWLPAESAARPSVPVRLDAYVAPFLRLHEFSGVILVTRDGQVVAQRSYGMANREFGVPNRPETRFLIGSISKEFTAAAILLLEQQGKLRTTDSLGKYIPGFPSGDRITLRQMLTHTSGISRDMERDEDYTVPHSSDELVALIKGMPLAFAPGTKSGYSNNAYKLLAYVIERASGQSYAEFLAASFFRPLQMTSTGELAEVTSVPRLAVGYSPGFGADGFGPAAHLDMSNARGSGSLYSTVADLARWNDRLLGPHSIAPAVRDSMLAGGGIGVGVARRAGRTVIAHNGVYQGYTSFLESYPEQHLTIAYLGNTETAASEETFERAVAAIALGDSVVPPALRPRGSAVPAQSARDYTGRFEFFPGLVVTIIEQDGHLLLGNGQGYLPVEWLGPDHMFFRLKYADLTFGRDASGHVDRLDWQEAGQRFPAKRLAGTEPSPH